MKTLEYHNGQDTFKTKLLNAWPFCLHKEHIYPLFAMGCCKQDGKWKWWKALGKDKTVSLYYNGIFYIRLMAPFWIGLHLRWAGKDPTAREYIQIGLGWKLNGRFAIHFRIHSDTKSSEGETGRNFDQAWGWDCGTK